MDSADTAQLCYLVRVVADQGYKVYPLRTREPKRQWHFPNGIAVISTSLSDALEIASKAKPQ